ncbi:MAG: tyrosine-type recombinase/integrase [Planctomycetota bacterium]|jgi:integrase
MASIYKRGTTWWVHYYVNGKSVDRSLRTGNERIARDRKRKLEAANEMDQLDAPSSTPITMIVQQYVEYLIATRPHKSAKNDLSYLRAFFGICCEALELGSHVPRKFRPGHNGNPKRELPKIKDKLKKRHVPVSRLEQITPEMISQFLLDRLVEDGIAPKTVNRQREVLRGLFTFALEHKGYVCPDRRYRHPVEGVRRHREQAPIISWLKADEIKQQLSVLEDFPTLKAMVGVYIFAGLRRAEALWLTQDDVDMNNRLIRVRAKTVRGNKWQPKTGRNRVIPIGDTLLTILQAYDTKQPERRTWFFLSPQAHPNSSRESSEGSCGRWDPDNLSAALRSTNNANGLSWSCLDFRHTFGSHLAQGGMSLFKIAELMGNSPEICRRHYAALVPEQMHDEINFFGSMKGSSSQDATPAVPVETEIEATANHADGTSGAYSDGDHPILRLVR